MITIGGQAASGKSTLAKELSARLGFKHVSAGALMRKMAEEKGMTLVEFSKYAEGDPEIDKKIDELQKKEATGDCVVDGRLSRFFLDPDLSIWLIAAAEVRAERSIGRGDDARDTGEAKALIEARDASERKRYVEFYGIDLGDLSKYDLVLNTDKFDIDSMVDVSIESVNSLRRQSNQ